MDTTGLIVDYGYYDWQVKRLQFVLTTYGENFFNGKKILEIGSYKGGMSLLLHNLVKTTGGSITSVEGLLENYNYCKETYPYINFIHYDLDSPNINDWIPYT